MNDPTPKYLGHVSLRLRRRVSTTPDELYGLQCNSGIELIHTTVIGPRGRVSSSTSGCTFASFHGCQALWGKRERAFRRVKTPMDEHGLSWYWIESFQSYNHNSSQILLAAKERVSSGTSGCTFAAFHGCQPLQGKREMALRRVELSCAQILSLLYPDKKEGQLELSFYIRIILSNIDINSQRLN